MQLQNVSTFFNNRYNPQCYKSKSVRWTIDMLFYYAFGSNVFFFGWRIKLGCLIQEKINIIQFFHAGCPFYRHCDDGFSHGGAPVSFCGGPRRLFNESRLDEMTEEIRRPIKFKFNNTVCTERFCLEM